MTAGRVGRDDTVRLICWDTKHGQQWSADSLRQMQRAPVCTAPMGDDICAAPIWAVDQDGLPRLYVGRGPHRHWERWVR